MTAGPATSRATASSGLELDRMADPPSLHVATAAGAAVIRVFSPGGRPPSAISHQPSATRRHQPTLTAEGLKADGVRAGLTRRAAPWPRDGSPGRTSGKTPGMDGPPIGRVTMR